MSERLAAGRGLLLFAHGARDPAWLAPFESVLARVRERRRDTRVVLAFLELMEPGLEAAAAQLVEHGCTQIGIVPLFLGAGGHVRRDMPLLVQRLRELYPRADWMLHDPVGEHPDVIEAIARAAAVTP